LSIVTSLTSVFHPPRLVVKMASDKLFEKARKLVESRRVEPWGQGIYNVIGDHGTHTVVRDYAGKVSCSCPGFRKKGKCSHVTAVMIAGYVKKQVFLYWCDKSAQNFK